MSILVGAKTAGATPLVIACRNGHYDVAEYLIEKCHADIEQPGSGKIELLALNIFYIDGLHRHIAHGDLTVRYQ